MTGHIPNLCVPARTPGIQRLWPTHIPELRCADRDELYGIPRCKKNRKGGMGIE